jgi:hypothetical protein
MGCDTQAVYTARMSARQSDTRSGFEHFSLLDELPAVVTLLIVAAGVAAPLLLALLLAV